MRKIRCIRNHLLYSPIHLLSWHDSRTEQSPSPRHPFTQWTPWQISSELQSPSFRQISWHTFLMQSSFEGQFASLLQIGLQNLWLQANPDGHCLFATQLEGSRTQPCTAVGLGRNPSLHEHRARCPTTVKIEDSLDYRAFIILWFFIFRMMISLD